MPGQFPPHEGQGAGDSIDSLLRDAIAESTAAYSLPPIPFNEFRDHALHRASARLRRAGREPAREGLRERLSRSVLRDLVLAGACEAGTPGAWECFLREFGPRIRSLARRQGASEEQAATLAEEIGGVLLLPPARGGARTRLGTYDGTGSLAAWLATIVAHRLADLRRSKPAVSLDTLLGRWESNEQSARPVAEHREDDPARAAADREHAASVSHALRAALESLTDREREALLARYADGLSQEEVARRLGVGAPRVSRLLSQAHDKLRESVSGRAGGLSPSQFGDRVWSSIRDDLGRHLVTLRGSGGDGDGGERASGG